MLFFILKVLTLLVSTTYAKYELVDYYSPNNFASKFDFFTDDDPTYGYVNYVDQDSAERLGLFKQQDSKVYMGVDHTNTGSGRGRNSIRISSKAAYTHGLFILDLDHMPDNQCGTWPAFWTVGPDWPNNGEIDIIEGVNTQASNSMALHTNTGCSITNTHNHTGHIVWYNCDIKASGQPSNAGCDIKSDDTRTYGSGLNAVDGGVYVMEWTTNTICVLFFPRLKIPSDIISGYPDPGTWQLPLAKFSGCAFDKYFHNHSIVFDITFCGHWAGSVWSTDPINAEDCTNCNFYQCYENKMKCGSNGYLIAYGKKYCDRFNSTLSRFDPAGKQWVSCVRQCLINFLKPSCNTYPNNAFKDSCDKLKDAAFKSHVKCYTDCGFCNICKTNKLALIATYQFSDFFFSIAWKQVEDTMKHCGGSFSCF
ncbi:hypothetical protein FO519_004787 [Halicephalobus sp. NKZ332]|nr:hypothetical protein FO519_004787 [Halicephalobus sp. NKZ332]